MTAPIQIRTHCWFPTRVEVPWEDANGTKHLWQWEADPKRRAVIRDDINRQMDAWSKELFKLSKRRYALCYKSNWAEPTRPLSGAKKRSGEFWLKPRHIEPVVVPDDLANVVLFFFPKGGEDKPPLHGGAYKTHDRLNEKVRCLVFPTHIQLDAVTLDPSRRMDAFRDEFWHLLQSAHCEASGTRPPSDHNDEIKHRPDLWHYLYAEAASRTMCRELRTLWGWKCNWGCAPSVMRGMGYEATATQNQANLQGKGGIKGLFRSGEIRCGIVAPDCESTAGRLSISR